MENFEDSAKVSNDSDNDVKQEEGKIRNGSERKDLGHIANVESITSKINI